MKHQILLYYKYVLIEDPKALMDAQRDLCQKLNLKGRIIIATEGINGTVEGLFEDTEKYVAEMQKDPRFVDMNFKKSEGTGNAFPRLSIKVRTEIVSSHLGEKDIDPTKITGKYITAEQLHELIHSGKEFYIVDMRNDYEHRVGQFENSILPQLQNFRDLKDILPQLESLKNKTVVTVCTGGVRCEKASGFLVANGFNDVYQLQNGIVTYMEKYPNEDFKGKLYVFDGRMTIGFNTEDPKHEIISNCDKCGKKSDHYVDCNNKHCKGNRHYIECEECIAKDGGAFCSEECKMEVNAKVKAEVSVG